jgi:hypothetical protein
MRDTPVNDSERTDCKEPELEHDPGDILPAQVLEAAFKKRLIFGIHKLNYERKTALWPRVQARNEKGKKKKKEKLTTAPDTPASAHTARSD